MPFSPSVCLLDCINLEEGERGRGRGGGNRQTFHSWRFFFIFRFLSLSHSWFLWCADKRGRSLVISLLLEGKCGWNVSSFSSSLAASSASFCACRLRRFMSWFSRSSMLRPRLMVRDLARMLGRPDTEAASCSSSLRFISASRESRRCTRPAARCARGTAHTTNIKTERESQS